jgi:zinc transporter ZupT
MNEVTDRLADELNAGANLERPNKICCTSLTKGINKVKPIGWMAIFGDGLGNFIDGLSIGASINQNLLLGVTTALTCWLGNIPQELGKLFQPFQ